MITQSSVSYNGVLLTDVDDSIVVRNVTEQAASVSRSETGRAGGVGSFIGIDKRTSCDVTVEFAIQMKGRTSEKQNLRREILDKVSLWAMGAKEGQNSALQIGSRDGQKLMCRASKLFDYGVARDWTGTYKLVFRANETPFWLDEGASVKKNLISSGTLNLDVSGTSKTPLLLSFKNSNTVPISNLMVSANGCSITFDKLALAVGETLVMDRNNTTGIQRIRVKDADGAYHSAYNRRSIASDDEVWLYPGVNTVTVKASKAGDINLSYVGRYV